MQIIFIPTEECNLKCWYCSRGCNVNQNVFECDPLQFRRLLNWISIQEPDELDFEFFGGEPTVHKDLLMMAWMLEERFGNKLVRLEILTNLIKPIGYYEMGFPDKTKFSCSYHSDSGDGDEWMQKVLRLHQKDLLGDVKMVMTPDNEKYISDLFHRYKDNDFRIYEILPQEQLEGTEWAENLNEKYGEFIFDYIGDYRPRTNYKGMVCTAGYKISQEGDLYHCWRKFNDPECKPIANVFKDTPTNLSRFHICSYDDCDINDVEFDKYSLEDFKNEVSKRSNR